MTGSLQVTGVVDAVADGLRSIVLEGGLAPGSQVTESLVAERFGVARASAKAAIEKLVAEGLLQRTVHRSARVRLLDAEAIRDVYQTRRRIESEAIRDLAASREVPQSAVAANAEIAQHRGGSSIDVVDPDMGFHMSLVDGIRSERTSRAYRSLVVEVRLCMAQVQGRRLISADLILDEHARILGHIADGNGDAALALLGEHLGRAERRLIEALGPTAEVSADR